MGGEARGEASDVATRVDQGLDNHDRMLRIVGDHASSEEEAVAVGLAEEPEGSVRSEALIRQAERVADGGSDQTAGKAAAGHDVALPTGSRVTTASQSSPNLARYLRRRSASLRDFRLD